MKGGGKKRTDLNEKNFLKRQRRVNTHKLSLIQDFQDNQLSCFSVTLYRLTEIFMLLVYKTKLNPPQNSCNHGPLEKPSICLPSPTSTGIWSVQTNPVTIPGESRSWTALSEIDETNETACKP